MATIASLNVRIGAEFKDLERGIKNAERVLRTAGTNLSSLGQSITLGLTAPLAAIGGIAIQQAGRMEALKLAMVSTFEDGGRSAQEATDEIEKLRIAALAPGLDFEQAVKASIRMQSVGFEADQARKIVVELANAIASTGGTSQELEGVVTQFTQMIGKGKVYQEDLRIILSNMPKLATVMQEVFGTTSAEALNEAGVNAKEFITRITEAMTELPRVQGGIANAIVNVSATARQALAKIGEAINETFDVTGALDRFSAWLGDLAERFAKLDSGTKRLILSIAAFAGAIGPALLIVGKLITAWNSVRTAVGLYTLAVKTAAAQSKISAAALAANGTAANATAISVGRLTLAWRALGAAQKATLIGGAVAVIAALGAAMYVYSRNTSDAAVARDTLNGVERTAIQNTAEQRTRVELLANVVRDSTKTEDERRGALEKLIQISPEHFKVLDTEKIKTSDVTAAVDAYNGSLLKAAKAQAAFNVISKNAAEILDLQLKKQGELNNSEKIAASLGSKTNKQAIEIRNKNIDEQIALLEKQNKAIQGLIEVNDLAAVAGDKLNQTPINPNADGLDAAKTKAEAYAKALASIAAVAAKGDVLGADVIGEQATEIENQIERLLEVGFKPYSKEIDSLRDKLRGLRSEVTQGIGEAPGQLPSLPVPQAVQSETGPFAGIIGTAPLAVEAIRNVNVEATNFQNTMTLAADALSGVFGTALEGLISGASAFRDFAAVAVDAVGQVIKALVQQAVASVISANLRLASFLGPAAIPVAAAAGTAASSIFSGIIKRIGKFADGGVITKPTLGLIGEYAGASTNPEIITPERLLRSIFREESGGGAQELYSVIRGDDLLLVSDRARNKRNRVG